MNSLFYCKNIWKRFVALVLVSVMLVTNINLDSYAAGMSDETENDVTRETIDITDESDHLSLMFTKWWSGDSSDIHMLGDSDRTIDMSEYSVDAEKYNDNRLGLAIGYKAYNVISGDTFQVMFPKNFDNIKVADNYTNSDIDIRIEDADAEHGMKLVLTFQGEGEFAGEIPVEFSISASGEQNIILQKIPENTVEYKFIPPLMEQRSDSVRENGENTNAISDQNNENQDVDKDYVPNEDAEDTDENDVTDTNTDLFNKSTFSIKANLAFDEKTADGTDWRELIRPLEFDQDIVLTAEYTDGEGNTHTANMYAQEDQPKESYYLMITHDGEGGGSIEIADVPNYVTVDGVEYPITKYTVNVKSALPYYESKGFDVNIDKTGQTVATVSTLELVVKSQRADLTSKVIGDDAAHTFKMSASYTNNQENANPGRKTVTRSYDVSSDSDKTIYVPVGISYDIKQTAADGYKLSSDYQVVKKSDGKEDEVISMPVSASGVIEDGQTLSITATNYSQNRSYSFDVEWIDNNNSNRPELTADNFELLYKTKDGEWTKVTEDQLDILGIDKMPVLDTSKAAQYKYSFTGLPGVDAEGDEVEFKVMPSAVPSGYVADADENDSKITYRAVTDYNASISWLDNHNEQKERPEISSLADMLKLYRRIDGGEYEEVTGVSFSDAITAAGGSDTWNVNIEKLPRYNDNNQEYDYVLVQGSINGDAVSQKELTGYRTYYNNGSGNYGNDVQLCHNGGKITERIYSTQDFTVKKVWKDTGIDKESRPAATVTLWRYALTDSTNDPGIDKMYADGKAAKVIYRKPETGADGAVTYSDVLLSYELDGKEDEETIVFDHTTVPDMPEGLKLPMYDEQGHKYVYFVRETLASDTYETSYGDCSQGVGNDGTLTNTRRQKAAVDVSKLWKCPSDLTNLDGVSVQYTIKAPLAGENENELKELTVYSHETGSYEKLTGDEKNSELTISGFSSSVSALQSTVYVNIYDENGNPYDMTKAVIEEVFVAKTNGTSGDSTTVSVSGNKFTLNGAEYNVSSKYIQEDKMPDGMKRYSYNLSNTISGKREYTIEKNWSKEITDEDIANVSGVTFTLKRKSTKDGSSEEVVGQYTAKAVQDSRTWTEIIENLDKYDEDGYAYSYYAEESSISFEDGTNETPAAKGWAVAYYRSADKTIATNYKHDTGSKYIHVSKSWNDNGDVAARKPVTVIAYRKAELKAVLDKMSPDEHGYVSVDDIDNAAVDGKTISYAVFENLLSSGNNWFQDLTLKSIEEKMGNTVADDKQLNVSDYIILEYYAADPVSVKCEKARYSYETLKTMVEKDSAVSEGYTRNETRQYSVEVNKYSNNVVITNTRIGKVSVKISKTWNDEHDRDGIRPTEVNFQLYRNGEIYIPGEDSDIQISADTLADTIFDKKTGVLTLSGGKNAVNWSATLENLPLFSDMGSTYTYSVQEITTLSKYISSRTQAEVSTTDIPDDIVYTFGFVNTASDTTSHYALKVWKDSATGGEDRPDLYFTLYRYLRGEHENNPETAVEKLTSYEQYSGYKDQSWVKGEDGSGYDWKIEVSDLPKYNAFGQEYVYVFKERMNNDGVNVYGKYRSSAKTVQVTVNDHVESHEEFVNTITDEMTVSGDKVWLGLSGYHVTDDDLPSPVIKLYRTLRSDVSLLNKTDEEVNKLEEDGTITFVNETVMDKDKHSFAFPDVSQMTDEDKKSAVEENILTYNETMHSYALPKFDENGNRYVYVLYEELKGTAGQLYTQVSAKGTLSNTFRNDVNRRTIRVTKTWTGRDNLTKAEQQYPSVTYNLYRYVKKDGAGKAQLIDTVKISASDFAGKENGMYSHDFTDLLVYSPSGDEYGYFVTENAIKGYKITYTDEEGIAEGYSDNNQSDVISVPANALKKGEPDVTTIGTNNSYEDAGNITISGSKYWDDYGNSDKIYGNRPESIKVRLYRYTQHENGQMNKVDSEEISLVEHENVTSDEKNPYIVWNISASDKNRWEYHIYNLEQYAPNGMPYVYSVVEEEDAAKGYKKSRKTVTATANGTNVKMNELTNSFGGSYYVRKNWMDGNNKYGLRPSSVTIVLQRRIKGSSAESEWKNIAWDDSFGSYNSATGKWTGLPSVTNGETDGENSRIVSVELTAANVINNTKGNSWDYTFTNLPEYDKEGDEWEYRCIETKVGSVDVTEIQENDGSTSYTAGAYTRTYTEQSGSRTVVQNKLQSTSLLVTKEWIGDENDMYHTRPDSLSFVLQMRGIKPDKDGTSAEDTEDNPGDAEKEENTDGDGSLTDWQDVTLADGSSYTFTITKKDNWTKILEDLPVATVDSDGKTYYTLYFRAKELHGSENQTSVEGALNYRDITSYDTESADHKYNKDAARNESVITNELIKNDRYSSISVTKKWNRQPGDEVSADFELLYHVDGENADVWHCFDDDSSCTSGSAAGCREKHSAESGCVIKTLKSKAAGEETFTWDNLPVYDRDGHKLSYKVIEHDVNGYTTDVKPVAEDGAGYATSYTFTNTELQDYTVNKTWQNTEYAEKNENGKFTATFKLQMRLATSTDAPWEDVGSAAGKNEDEYVCTLSSTDAKAEESYTWKNLPKYTVDGREIVYRAVEVSINGKAVSDNTNGAYIVIYKYGSDNGDTQRDNPAFADTATYAVNRMVYGFVNMSKAAAYLTSAAESENTGSSGTEPDSQSGSGTGTSVTPDSGHKLEGVTFDIYKLVGGIDSDLTGLPAYISGVKTDKNGNLICNSDGTYGEGDGARYLVSGTYKLVETGTHSLFSIWNDGVLFTVGLGDGTTGEHGTAWVYTDNAFGIPASLSLKVRYVKNDENMNHKFADNCRPLTNTDDAYNIESRGVIEFTKTGSSGKPLDIHAKASGESKPYFGVYTDRECTEQVAGMVAVSDGKTFVLSALDSDCVTDRESEFTAHKDSDNVPYLRKDANGVLTLSSGIYYIKELVAPAGYKLDTAVRKAVVPKLDKTGLDVDLSAIYTSNKADITLADAGNSDADSNSVSYSWTNDENKVVIYKRDQYGRIVKLKDNGYLELTAEGDVTFLTGESIIRLYQRKDKPAAKADGSDFADGAAPDITYDETNGCWTITGLFDAGKTYTISEPQGSVPDSNIIAKSFTFTMNADGTISVDTSDNAKEIAAGTDVLGVRGDDHQNYYQTGSDVNKVVLRDVSRYLSDVALKKIELDTDNPIANISFELYRYDSIGADGEPKGSEKVLPNNKYLTTGADGIIDLEKTADGIKNALTGHDLKYGLEIGKYYFKEIERGASDRYRLSDNIYFEIRAKEPSGDNPEYKDYAEVVFVTNSYVTQEKDTKLGVVSNTPVTDNNKTLELTKVDSEDSNKKLANARFTLDYTSVNIGSDGHHDSTTVKCVTDANGTLYVVSNDWSISSGDNMTKPDISKKGHYVLTEILAPDDYMTRTNEDGACVTLLEFDVDSSNNIENVKEYAGFGNLVTAEVTKTDDGSESKSLDVTVKNDKTVVSVIKKNDIEETVKTRDQKSLNGETLAGAELAIYEGVYSNDSVSSENSDKADNNKKVVSWQSADKQYDIPVGTLKENNVYTLHESEAPVGYMAADDIYFQIYGTTEKSDKVIAQIYVWTGSGAPNGEDLTGKSGVPDSSKWSKVTSINDDILTMVDEAVIAPVDAQKVVGKDGSYNVLPGAEFEVTANGPDSQSDVVLGTVVSGNDGYLVWKSIEDTGYNQKVIYNAAGKRVSSGDADSVIGKTVILQQNENGYSFREIYAPDNAYNEGECFTANITAANYKEYKAGKADESVYDGDKYIDIVKAEGSESHTVAKLSVRSSSNISGTSDDLVNPPFEAAFELYKYDAENPDIKETHDNYDKIGMVGVEFTLEKQQSDGSYKEVGKYITGENGLLHIDIKEKGTYRLSESKTLEGYKLSDKTLEFTVVNGDYKKTLTYDGDENNAKHTAVIGAADVYSLPNNREHGTVILVKVDADSGKRLNGVKYSLKRIGPAVNGVVDKWFPSNAVQQITVETGNTYDTLASASTEDEFTSGIKQNNAADTGKLIINDLQWGDYELTESEELDGYIIGTKTYTFTISQNDRNKFIYDDESSKTDVQNKKNQLTVVKTDMDGKELSGAEFELRAVDNNGVMSTDITKFYSDANDKDPAGTIITAGNTTIYGIPKGAYVLRETKAPAGYELTRDVYFVMGNDGKVSGVSNCTVDADNKVKVNGSDSGSAGTSSMASFSLGNTGSGGNGETAGTPVNIITVKDNPIEVSLTKKLSDNDNIGNRGDAIYEISGVGDAKLADGSTSQTFTGNVITGALKAQLVGGCSYTITEVTAPAGYEVPKESVTIDVATDGKITVKGECSFLKADNTGTDGVAKLTFTDDPIEIDLSKVGESGNVIDEETFGYAQFSVTGKLVSKDGTEISDDTVSNLTTLNFKSELKGRLIADEIYKVEETKAPDGYKLTKPFFIQIDKYGQIVKRGDSENTLSDVKPGTDKLVVQDEPIAVTFKKVDETGKTVSGAKFTLTAADVSSDGTVSGTTAGKAFVNMTADIKPADKNITDWTDNKISWTSTDDVAGITFTNHLITGVKYKLHEERVLYHEVMENDIEFTVKGDGTIEINKNSDIPNNAGMQAASLDTDKVVMTITNPVIKGSVTLTKYWKDSSSAADVYDKDHILEGAVYTLTRVKGAAETDVEPESIKAVYNDDGTYAYSGNDEISHPDAVSRFVTNKSDQIIVTGLPEGTYEFLEVDAPKAYHINNADDQKIQFKIVNDDKAHVILPETDANDDEKAKLMDTRVNAKISLTKLSGGKTIAGAVFDVSYSETLNGTYASIGTLTTDDSGKATFSKGKYVGSDTEEGLRRGFYILTEKSADGGQMMNTVNGQRNTISFEIGNEIDHEYTVDSSLQEYLNNNKLEGVKITNSQYISLSNGGVANTAIPTKSVTVTKKWSDDTGLDKTFRPEKITVQLYRSYNNKAAEKVQINGKDATAELNSAGNWTYTWNNLPAYVTVKDTDGKEITYLYTYTVKETDKPSWYDEKYEYNTKVTKQFEEDVQDGDTAAEITNTLSGGKDKKTLAIRKTIGGGSGDDTFKVRIKLTKDGKAVGNSTDGYYLDECKVYSISDAPGTDLPGDSTDADTSSQTVIPDADGWMTIKGGQEIVAEIPKGMTYEAEEKLDDSHTYVTASSGLKYTPRYDANRTGTMSDKDVATIIRNAVHKSLNLVKQDDAGKALAGTKIKVTYTPLTGSAYAGKAYEEIYETDVNGQIRDIDGNPLDLTSQGTYEIREIRASGTYITPTSNDGTVKLLATVVVDANDKMTVTANETALVTAGMTVHDSQADITIKNEKTKVLIGKTIDNANGKALSDATLEIYKADDTDADKAIDSWTTAETDHEVQSGLLSENVVYRLHEKENSAPVGYLETDDVYFKLDGTYTDADGNRYSRIVLTDQLGNALDSQNEDGMTYGEAGVVGGVLKIVDKTIQVPVTLKKMLKKIDGNSIDYLPNVIFTVKDNDKDTVLGTAKTSSYGYLQWEKTENEHKSGEWIVLQQNNSGYTFTETYAPDNAYNDGRSFVVNPTDDNFRDYLKDKALKLNVSDSMMENTDSKAEHGGFFTEEQQVINAQYRSTVTLTKYDADEEANRAGIAGTEFTLYKAEVNGDTWTAGDVVKDAYQKDKTGTITPKESGVFTTDSDGTLSVEIRNKGYYILRETKAAEGYQLDKNNPAEFRFQLVDKATVADNENGIYGYDTINTLKQDETGVPNSRIMGSVTLTKTDKATNELLSGVEFVLTRTDSKGESNEAFLLHEQVSVKTGKTYTAEKVTDKTMQSTKWILKESDGTPGVIKVEGLNWGTYKLCENTELSGYVKSDKEYTFEIKSTDRDVKVHDDGTDVVTNEKNKVVFKKLGTVDGGDSKALAGAVFEVHEGSAESDGDICKKASFYTSDTVSGEDSKVTNVVSGADGTVTIYGLATDTKSDMPKTYHLVETTAPKGYKIAAPVEFTIDRHGKVRVLSSEVSEVTMTDEPIKLYIEKIGEEKATKLSGAEFELTDVCTDAGCDHTFADGTAKAKTVITSSDKSSYGTVMIPVETVIAGHTYQLKETKAPDGYECTAVVTFTVDKDGKAEIKSASGGYSKNTGDEATTVKNAELDAEKTTLTISNERIGLSLVKEDYDDTNKKLAGVKFTLEPENGSSFVESYKTEHSSEFDGNAFKLAATDNNGELTIPLELLKHDNSYILTEADIGSNAEYRFAEKPEDRQITFTVNKDGTLTITNENDMFSLTEGDATRLVVKNQKIDLAITKLDQVSGKPLADVTLKLSRLDENGAWQPVSQSGVTNDDGTWTTAASGKVTFKGDGFTAGTYMVEETVTPENYNSIPGPLILVINDAGRVTQTAVGSYDSQGNVTYTLSDISESKWSDRNFTITNPEDGKAGGIALNVTNAAYTDLQITKTDPDGNKITGVEFMLEYKDSDGSWQKIQLTTGTDGIATFGNLPNGTYRLTETKTAKGYNLLGAPIEITIDRNSAEYNAKCGDGTSVKLAMENGTNTLLMTVVNKKGLALPKTGTTTPSLPVAVLPVAAFIEALILYLYGSKGKRRRKKGVKEDDR